MIRWYIGLKFCYQLFYDFSYDVSRPSMLSEQDLIDEPLAFQLVKNTMAVWLETIMEATLTITQTTILLLILTCLVNTTGEQSS